MNPSPSTANSNLPPTASQAARLAARFTVIWPFSSLVDTSSISDQERSVDNPTPVDQVACGTAAMYREWKYRIRQRRLGTSMENAMMRRTFLKLAAFLGLARPAAEGQALQFNELPWYPKTPIRGNLAVGNLRENLLARLKTERGVHTETLATGIGVIVGFAAQNAALVRAAETTKAKGAVVSTQDLLLANGADGKRYIFRKSSQ